jgi:CubicO group peptidase (beta-lactamase class C family)
MTSAPVGGLVAPRLRGLRDAFAGLFADGESGAALAVIHDGELVADLYGGWRDAARTRPWTPDTLVHVFSAGKAVVAAGLVRLADQGRLDLDDPVARHWTGFRAAATVRHVLAHAAGLPAFPAPLPVGAAADWHRLAADLAGASAEFEPGTAVAEHAMTYGHLVGELIRRVDGRLPGEYLRAELGAPWGLDLALGATPAEQARTAELEYADPGWPEVTAGEAGSYRRRVLDNPPGWLALDVVNSAAWRAAQVPAVNLHTTALSLARFYAGLLAGGEQAGVRLFSAAAAGEIARPHAEGTDLLLGRPVAWGLGVQVDESAAAGGRSAAEPAVRRQPVVGAGEWGMGGIGGCDAFASSARGYAYAYVTRRLGGFEPSERLIEALEAEL